MMSDDDFCVPVAEKTTAVDEHFNAKYLIN